MRSAIRSTALAAGLLLSATLPVAAQQRAARECQPADEGGSRTRGSEPPERYREYDVIVDVPDLCVERIRLQVRNLDAHLSLNSRVANLVQVQAGADVSIREVDLGIRGVRAQALLLVDLDNVAYIVNRTLTFIDRNPQVVEGLMGTVQGALGTVGGVADRALAPDGAVSNLVGTVGRTLDQVTRPGGVLTRTVNQAGETVVRTLDATGSIVEHTADAAGSIVGSRAVGNLLDLDVLQETTDAAGRTVRQVRDASGALVEYTLGTAGNVTNARVLQPAGGVP